MRLPRRYFPTAPTDSSDLSVNLQSIGLLSALIFLFSTLFEFLVLTNVYPQQHDLLLLLLLTLSIWALLEAVLIRPARNFRALQTMKGILAAQLGFILIRSLVHSAAHVSTEQNLPLSTPQGDWLASTLFILIELLVFLATSRCLVMIYGHAERLKTRLLTKQMQLLEKARHDLMASESRYRNIFNQQLVGTAILCKDRRFLAMNERCAKILGYTDEDILGRPWQQIIRPVDEPPHAENFERLLGSKPDGFEIESRLARRDGSVISVMLSGRPSTANHQDSSQFYLNIIDITQRKQIESELAAALVREKELLKHQRDELETKLRTSLTAAALVHEIQQPLSSILLNCRLADDGLRTAPPSSIPAQLRTQLLSLKDEGERVSQSMERVRMLLRNVESNHTLIDFCLNIDSALVFLKNDLLAHQIRCHCIGTEKPCLITADGAQLQIAVVNLIRNAIQAMAAQAPSSRQIQIELMDHGPRVQLRISDSGPGFPADYSRSTPYELLRTTKPDGLGIGLFVVETAVTNHQGQVHLGRSASLGGADVLLDLPRGAAMDPTGRSGQTAVSA